jgi:hypothetical protein
MPALLRFMSIMMLFASGLIFLRAYEFEVSTMTNRARTLGDHTARRPERLPEIDRAMSKLETLRVISDQLVGIADALQLTRNLVVDIHAQVNPEQE